MIVEFNGTEREIELVRFGDLKEEDEFIETNYFAGVIKSKKVGSKVCTTPDNRFVNIHPDTIVIVERRLDVTRNTKDKTG